MARGEWMARNLGLGGPTGRRGRVERKLVASMAALLVTSVGLNVWQGTHPAVREPPAMVRPHGGQAAPGDPDVEEWLSKVTSHVLTLTFGRTGDQLGAERASFTPPGYDGLMATLAASDVVGRVSRDQLVTSAVPSGAPVVLSRSAGSDGRQGWRMQVPMVLTFESSSDRWSERHVVDADVEWAASADGPGLVVTRFSMSAVDGRPPSGRH